MSRTQLRSVSAAPAADLAAQVRAALARLAEENDGDAAFIVTQSGIEWARADAHDPAVFHLHGSHDGHQPLDLTPRWDRNNRVLSFDGQIVKQYGRSSPNQETVLQAFEEQGWPYRIDDPLPYSSEIPPKLRLHDTIRWLNLKHECRFLRFMGDGTGEGIRWKLVANDGLSLPGSPADALRRAA